jgi:hypothetical protein
MRENNFTPEFDWISIAALSHSGYIYTGYPIFLFPKRCRI